MDGHRFDRLTRRLATTAPRRALLAVGAMALGEPQNVAAKPRRNAFGCLDVGKHCDGRNRRCCSGLCQGNRKKQGKKDKSRCVAHNVGDCQPGDDACAGVDVACGTGGFCYRTTGKAGFCGADPVACMVCRNDRDCQGALGAGAACVVCESCVEIDGSRTACVLPRA